MRASFIQIPVELLDDPAISAVEFRLYSILLRYGLEGRGYSQAGTAMLAKKCKCCQQTITRSLKNLAAAGYISIERIGLNRNNRLRCHRTVKRSKSTASRISQKSPIKNNEECAILHYSDKIYKRDRRLEPQNLEDLNPNIPSTPPQTDETITPIPGISKQKGEKFHRIPEKACINNSLR